MKKTIEISLDAVVSVLPCLESQLEYLAGEVARRQAEHDALKTTIAELKAKMQGDELPLVNGKFRQRSPKGQGQRLIFEILQALPEGEGLSMAEIEQRTGVNHATVFRTLKNPKRNNGRFQKTAGNRWMLSGLVTGSV